MNGLQHVEKLIEKHPMPAIGLAGVALFVAHRLATQSGQKQASQGALIPSPVNQGTLPQSAIYQDPGSLIYQSSQIPANSLVIGAPLSVTSSKGITTSSQYGLDPIGVQNAQQNFVVGQPIGPTVQGGPPTISPPPVITPPRPYSPIYAPGTASHFNTGSNTVNSILNLFSSAASIFGAVSSGGATLGGTLGSNLPSTPPIVSSGGSKMGSVPTVYAPPSYNPTDTKLPQVVIGRVRL